VLAASAYTLRRKARLAVSLAWIGGFVDAVGYVAVFDIFTSHMTGNTARLGAELAHGDASAALRLAFPIAMFFAGAFLSGVLTVGGARVGIRSTYALALSFEVALLGAFGVLAWESPHAEGSQALLLVALAAVAMGLQNATITQIAGAVVRTTHVSGVITDLGIESVQLLYWLHDQPKGKPWERFWRAFRLSRRHPSVQRLVLLLSIWGSFLAGAVLGVWAFGAVGIASLAGPIGFLVFLIVLDVVQPIANLQHVDHKAEDKELTKFGIEPGLLPPNVGVYRIRGEGQRRARAPDLGRLAERIGAESQVVMLILAEDVELDDNNLMGLVSSLKALRGRSADLVLCVTNSKLFLRIRGHAIGEELGASNLCPDPEFAVARAIEIASDLAEDADA
jgi:uncharacterized membrane protein YoaK (UPF0700 family)